MSEHADQHQADIRSDASDMRTNVGDAPSLEVVAVPPRQPMHAHE